jgi:hypothetical protein
MNTQSDDCTWAERLRTARRTRRLMEGIIYMRAYNAKTMNVSKEEEKPLVLA